ncbi:hypothetical protein PM10SUCC1_04770 [Propionigenium maris DSM 9537]|uniref:Nucleotidyltransferase n=1 Tax=Propionigenium maris DSM 9537 TaxID=1123000 RepID=A0A9W6LLS3_9FUSO|nr:hypothetical protein [Propionigenium maris]GLI54962.1 hypothetical protein PM10SUCC1_04770 [Propionigenium maris DSM 9537]
MGDRLRDVLKRVAKLLNNGGITWAVGASVMLNHYGLVEETGDIDIMVSMEDIQRLDSILSKLGERVVGVPDETYKTKYFYEYMIDGVEVDVMAGLCVHREGRDHSFPFNRDSIGEWMEVDGVEVPLAKLEEWYEIYKVLPGRERKAEAIGKYLDSHHPRRKS